jgi:lysophospholipase L1-like esterase
VLENLQEPIEVADGLELGKVRGMTNIRKRNLKQKVHKVILIGDSHARGCVEKISNYLGNSYEVTRYVNPGTGLEVITNSATKEIDRMTPKDVVIVCGGSNNISKNESIKGFKQVTQFVQNRGNTNVIIMNTPHRFDLEESSCMNKEIEIFNRKLKRIMKIYNHTEVIDMSVNRDHYTKHGLHMNKTGKEWRARRTADTINKLSANQKLEPITLEWKESSVKRNEPETTGYKESDYKVGQQEVRTSSRTQKQPGKTDTFFMVNTIVGGCEIKEKGEKQVRIDNNLNVVHQNIRSLWEIYGELEILLETEINNVEVLCFTEHWLNCHKIHAININNFTLTNAFCRRNSDHGGSCIFVKKGVITKELNPLNELGEEESFELSVTELVQYAIIVICIYRSPD